MTGINGWGMGMSRPVLDAATSRKWLGAVHGAMRATTPHGRVLGEVREPGPGWNYYSVLVDTAGDQRRRLLLNAAAGLVACALDERSPAVGPLHFCEVPSPEVFLAAAFRVASVDEMDSQLRPEHVAALSPDEQADVDYHQPGTVGDVLFNWFD